MRAMVAGLILAAMAAAPCTAGPLTAKEARRELFPVRGVEVSFPEAGLSAADAATLHLLFRLSDRDLDAATLAAAGLSGAQAESAIAALKLFRGAKYYGAVAASPAGGIVSPATQMVQDLHGRDAARSAALALCRAAGGTGCVIVAEVLPKGFAPRAFTLSQSATGDFAGFRRGNGPRALAVSGATPAYAIARGYGARKAAVGACNRLAGTDDCAVAVHDE